MNTLLITEQAADAGISTGGPPVVVVDDQRVCIEANGPACELLGAPRDEVVGQRLDSLFTPEMRGRLLHFWRAFAQGGGHAGPFSVAAGGEIELSVSQNVIPGRHLLVLSATSAEPRRPVRVERRAPLASQSETPGRGPSAREREVLRLLATGATDPQIARTLGLSPATVQTHVRNVKAKLGARTRAQAVALGISRGLIEPAA